jgi:hypothetical protein
MEPQQLPEFVHDLAEWTRRSAGTLWCNKAGTGSRFYWPPTVDDPTERAMAARHARYDQVLDQTRANEVAQSEAQAAQYAMSIASFKDLADYHATTLEQAKLFYIGRDISYLAARTEMKDFRLDLDLFYLDPKQEKSLMACGFIMWDTPIGEAEPRGAVTAQYSMDTGELLEVDVVDDMMEGFRESETPVNALSWRILPGAKEVLVVLYTDGAKARAGYERYLAAQKGNLPPGMAIDKSAAALQMSDPQPLEREQVLPLGRTLAWFEDKSAEVRLKPTIESDPGYLRLAERKQIGAEYIAANEKILPMLSQMVKTFVATLAIRRMKLARQEEVPAPKPSVKRMRRSGASAERQEGGVQVIRIGKPLKHRAKAGDPGGGGRWKVKTVIGPVIRTRQYVPAYDEYRDGVWMIEPYVAGPEDAPWSKNAKVFLLE